MRAMSGVSKNRHGVYYVRKKVPKRLEQSTAEFLGNGKSSKFTISEGFATATITYRDHETPVPDSNSVALVTPTDEKTPGFSARGPPWRLGLQD
jgi:hypothetical protein